MNLSNERIIEKNKAYFDREAADFDAVEKDPEKIQDGLRQFFYKHFLKLHKENKRLIETLAIAKKHRLDWKDRAVLELGCGHGLYSIEFARLGARVTMVDYSKPMLDLSAKNLAEAGVADHATLVCADLRDLKLDKEKYDLVFLTGVTDYLPKSSLESLGNQIRRYADDLVIISFPMKYSPLNWVRWLWLIPMKRIFLAYFSWADIERFAQRHSLRIKYKHDMPGYYITGFTVG